MQSGPPGFDGVEIFENDLIAVRVSRVQRVGSYSSYGSANAAVRMTAQRDERTHRLN